MMVVKLCCTLLSKFVSLKTQTVDIERTRQLSIGMICFRRKIEARRSEQGVSLDRGMDLHITRTEQKERRRSQERFRKGMVLLHIVVTFNLA